MRARFAVDFDGTLVTDGHYPEVGEWLPGATEFLQRLECLGEVVIWTCRSAPVDHVAELPRPQEEVERDIEAIKEVLREHGFGHLEVWTKPWKPPAAAYIDNRAIHADGHFDEMLEDVLSLTAGEPVARWYTSRHPSSSRFRERIMAWIRLHDRKQQDYGSETDPFANIREGAHQLGLPAWVGCIVRMNDKMRRLNTAAKQWIATGKVNMANESLLDSFDDLGVYSGIGAVLLEEEGHW